VATIGRSSSVPCSERSIPTAQILFALTDTHRDFYISELDKFQPQRIVQPANKGTAPPILFSALSIGRIDEDALIAVLPGDHYYADEARLTAALESAFEIAAECPESVVLLGAQPNHPEIEYGWIGLGAAVESQSGELYRVREFTEKPPPDIARALFGDDTVWNTFVMVGHARAFLHLAAHAIPEVLEALRQAELWTGSETYIEESVYDKLFYSDFSMRVLSPEAQRLLVLRVRDLGWSDLGHPSRVMAVLEKSRSKPQWWTKELRKGMTAAVRRRAESAIAWKEIVPGASRGASTASATNWRKRASGRNRWLQGVAIVLAIVGTAHRRSFSTSSTLSGCFAMTASRTRVGASGRARPCSQFRSVAGGKPNFAANCDWLKPMRRRTADTSTSGI